MAHILVRFTQSPYQGSKAIDGVDFAMAATNYGHQVSALFEGNAVWMWQNDQQPPEGVKNLRKKLNALALFEVEPCYISRLAVSRQQVDIQSDQCVFVDSPEIVALLRQADHVVTF